MALVNESHDNTKKIEQLIRSVLFKTSREKLPEQSLSPSDDDISPVNRRRSTGSDQSEGSPSKSDETSQDLSECQGHSPSTDGGRDSELDLDQTDEELKGLNITDEGEGCDEMQSKEAVNEVSSSANKVEPSQAWSTQPVFVPKVVGNDHSNFAGARMAPLCFSLTPVYPKSSREWNHFVPGSRLEPGECGPSFFEASAMEKIGDTLPAYYETGANSQGFPTIYISPAGLITLLMKYDVAIEMTADKTIRVINHRHKAVAATSSRGNSSFVFHLAAKVYQDGTTTDAEVFWGRRARLTTDCVTFAAADQCFHLIGNQVINAVSAPFADLSTDNSVPLFFSTNTSGPRVLGKLEEVVRNASYSKMKSDGIKVRLNGMLVIQNGKGDVTVLNGPKKIFVSPVFGSMSVHTHFITIDIAMNWNTVIRRGGNTLSATYMGFMVNNGKTEAGFDSSMQLVYQARNTENASKDSKQEHHKNRRQSNIRNDKKIKAT